MPIPDDQTLMLPVLRAAADRPVRVGDLVVPLADAFGLSQEERRELLPSGRQRTLHNRIHWAKFYLSKAGLVSSPARGVFVATTGGKEVLRNAPAKIDNTYLDRFENFRAFRTGTPSADNAPSSVPPSSSSQTSQLPFSPDDMIAAGAKALRQQVEADLLERLRAVPPAFFEKVVVDLLVTMGYGGSHADAARAIGGPGDGGVDGVIDEDQLGLDRIYVQAKRYTGTAVSPTELRAFLGSLEQQGATKGVFVTTSTFTASGRAEMERVHSKRIRLLDGAELARLLVEHGVGVVVRERLLIYDLDENYFTED